MEIRYSLFAVLLFRSCHGFALPRHATHSPAPFSASRLPSDEYSNDSQQHASEYKRWGVDKDRDQEYWFNSQIHSLGNTGFMGAIHAAMAPLATRLIDDKAYNGVNIRETISHELAQSIKNSRARVVDLCCGVGMSTRALQQAFPDAEALIGIDTSPEMISMAQFLSNQQSRFQPIANVFSSFFSVVNRSIKKKETSVKRAYVKATRAIAKFSCANAEHTSLPDKSFDLVTIMYALHEAPKVGREKILAEAARLLHRGGLLALIDITPDYKPSPSMLAGEPYVLEYQKNINHQLNMVKGFTKATFKNLVPGHVGLWLLRRA